MTQTENLTAEIIDQLNECIKLYSADNGGILYETDTVYAKGHETADYIKTYNADLYFKSYIVRFSYYPHVSLSMAHSVLTCYVSLNKNDSEKLFYPLSHIYGFLGITPANALTIPLILTPESMAECFECIAESLGNIESQIIELSCDQEKKYILFNDSIELACTYLKNKFSTEEELNVELSKAKEKFHKNLNTSIGKTSAPDEETLSMIENSEEYFSIINNACRSALSTEKQKSLMFYFESALVQSLSAGYEAYMTGNYSAAIKKFKKIKLKTPYETLLLNYMENSQSPQRHVPESVFRNLTELYSNGVSKNNAKEALALAPAMFIFGIMWVPLFLAIYFLFYFFESKDSLYLLGPLDNAPSVMLPALLMSLPTIYFNSKKFYKLFFKKNHKKLIELENATRTRSGDSVIKALAVILFIGSVYFLLFNVHQNIKLTETGFYDNTEFFSLKGSFYSYDDIELLKYQPETPKKSGGTFPFPSYVILLKTGEKIDISQFDSCKETFLNVFKSKNVKIEQPNPENSVSAQNSNKDYFVTQIKSLSVLTLLQNQ